MFGCLQGSNPAPGSKLTSESRCDLPQRSARILHGAPDRIRVRTGCAAEYMKQHGAPVEVTGARSGISAWRATLLKDDALRFRHTSEIAVSVGRHLWFTKLLKLENWIRRKSASAVHESKRAILVRCGIGARVLRAYGREVGSPCPGEPAVFTFSGSSRSHHRASGSPDHRP
jgi:hypothetical protein